MKKFLLAALLLLSFSLHEPAKAALTYPQLHNTPIKQIKGDTLPVKKSHSNRAATIETRTKYEAVYVSNQVVAGWVLLPYSAAYGYDYGYINQSMLTATIGYGNSYIDEPTIAKLTADQIVKDADGRVIQSFKKGDLVSAYSLTSSTISALNLQQTTGYIDEGYLQPVNPTIRQVHTKTGIVLREKPSPSAKVIGTLPYALAVRSYGQVAGGWRVVKYGTYLGYVPANTMEAKKPVTRFVTAQGLPVYEKASRSAKVNFVLEQGTNVQVYEGSGGWSYVYLGTMSGYVPTQFLTTQKPTITKTTTLTGLKMDIRAVKPHITKTETVKQGGKTFYVHTIHQTLGVQQAGAHAVYIQIHASHEPNNNIAKQLSQDTGTYLIGCNGKNLCQLTNNGTLQVAIQTNTWMNYDTFSMKRTAKGEIQIASPDTSGEYSSFSFETYRFDAKQQKFVLTDSVHFRDPQGSDLYKQWQEQATFVVK